MKLDSPLFSIEKSIHEHDLIFLHALFPQFITTRSTRQFILQTIYGE